MPIKVRDQSTDNPTLYHKGAVDSSTATAETSKFILVVRYAGQRRRTELRLSPAINRGESFPQKILYRIRELKMHRLSTLRKDLRRLDQAVVFERHWNHDKRCFCAEYPSWAHEDRAVTRKKLVTLIRRVDTSTPAFLPVVMGEELYLEVDPSIKLIPVGTVRSWRIHNP